MRHIIGLCTAVFILVASAGSALALDIPFVDMRVGVRAGPTISIISDVAEEDPVPVYPGFFGVGWVVGGGLSIDYLSIVGLNIEFLYSRDSVTGTVEWDDAVRVDGLNLDDKKESSDFTLEANQFHLPIYVRGQIPAGVARPFVNVGVDIVFKRSAGSMTVEQLGDAPPYDGVCDPGFDCDPFPARNYGVEHVDSELFVLVGLGLDIEVGPVDIPIEMRGLIRPGMSDAVDDRTVTVEGGAPEFLYRNEWEYQIQVLFGVNYRIF